jgi:hypothetical protein
MGGIQSSLGKRHRHRRVLVRMLFDYYESDRLILCLDPASLDLMKDFDQERSTLRILEIKCQFSDEYLIGHAIRVGLAGEHTQTETLDRLLPTIRNDITFESERIRDAGFAHFEQMLEAADLDQNARALGRFLGMDLEKARELADLEYLYAD